jgi:hypothetical protein
VTQQQPVQQVVVNVQNNSNGLGLAGLIFSILGWPTCGLLCIPGALLSLLGLFSKGPKGTAIAGLIVGFPGVLVFIFWGMALLLGAVGIGAAATGAVEQAREAARKAEALQSQTVNANVEEPKAEAAESTTESDVPTTDTIASEISAGSSESEPVSKPAEIESIPSGQPDASQTPEPAPTKLDPTTIARVFSDASGKFKVEAKVISLKDGEITLQRVDNAKEVKVQVKRLSDDDQRWISDNFGL